MPRSDEAPPPPPLGSPARFKLSSKPQVATIPDGVRRLLNHLREEVIPFDGYSHGFTEADLDYIEVHLKGKPSTANLPQRPDVVDYAPSLLKLYAPDGHLKQASSLTLSVDGQRLQAQMVKNDYNPVVIDRVFPIESVSAIADWARFHQAKHFPKIKPHPPLGFRAITA